MRLQRSFSSKTDGPAGTCCFAFSFICGVKLSYLCPWCNINMALTVSIIYIFSCYTNSITKAWLWLQLQTEPEPKANTIKSTQIVGLKMFFTPKSIPKESNIELPLSPKILNNLFGSTPPLTLQEIIPTHLIFTLNIFLHSRCENIVPRKSQFSFITQLVQKYYVRTKKYVYTYCFSNSSCIVFCF